jgi:3-isopropylmalate dehydrogenase
MTRRIAVLAGDGIGPEVIGRALAELPEDVELIRIDASAERYLETGEVITGSEVTTIRNCDALLFGAVGDPRVPDGVLERGILLKLRKDLDLYVNLRPVPELDLVIVRENTEGSYAGLGLTNGDSAYEISLNTRASIERCARYAADLAVGRGGSMTFVHKTNVLGFAGSMWREVCEDVARERGVHLRYEHADAAAYHLVTDPARFDVILTDNLFGDILSDVAAGMAGGLGRAASANLHPDPATRKDRCIGLFEPVHGSAPDIAGTGRADPTGAVRAARMMIDTLSRLEVPA